MTAFSRRFLLCAIAYVFAGMLLGIQMGAAEDFTLAPVHAHANLIGWTTMALFAFYYNAVPTAGETKLAQVHFWVSQIGLLLMLPSLAMALHGNAAGIPALIVGEILILIAMMIFAFTVWRNKAA